MSRGNAVDAGVPNTRSSGSGCQGMWMDTFVAHATVGYGRVSYGVSLPFSPCWRKEWGWQMWLLSLRISGKSASLHSDDPCGLSAGHAAHLHRSAVERA